MRSVENRSFRIFSCEWSLRLKATDCLTKRVCGHDLIHLQRLFPRPPLQNHQLPLVVDVHVVQSLFAHSRPLRLSCPSHCSTTPTNPFHYCSLESCSITCLSSFYGLVAVRRGIGSCVGVTPLAAPVISSNR